MRIRCTTRFDITATGVTGNHSRNRLPFIDATGADITDTKQWDRSRNRQRNWETLQQILNLRTLLESTTVPEKTLINGRPGWRFEFEIERPSSIDINGDSLGALKLDCDGVPMITGLDEIAESGDYLVYGHNIHFEIIDK